jgi:tetratricopeptide (TPR) repeat protein
VDPGACDGYRLEARALAAGGEVVQAIHGLERVVDRVTDRVGCLRSLAELARVAHDEPRFDTALNEIARAGCATEPECVNNLTWVAQAEEADGSPRRALATYRRAHERAPDDDALLERMGSLSVRAGLNAEALQIYQELAHRHPADGRWTKAAEEQREAMLRGALKF